MANKLIPDLVAADTQVTATALTSGHALSAYGQSITFTATVVPTSGSGETGTVQFEIDGANFGTR